MIEGGSHREAVFWMAVTYSRCQMVLHSDGQVESQEKFAPCYRELLADLGVTSFKDLQDRGQQVKELLPRIWAAAEAIMEATPGIVD